MNGCVTPQNCSVDLQRCFHSSSYYYHAIMLTSKFNSAILLTSHFHSASLLNVRMCLHDMNILIETGVGNDSKIKLFFFFFRVF